MTKQTKTVSIAGYLYRRKPIYGIEQASGYAFSSWKLDTNYLFELVFVKDLTVEAEVPLDFEAEQLTALEMS